MVHERGKRQRLHIADIQLLGENTNALYLVRQLTKLAQSLDYERSAARRIPESIKSPFLQRPSDGYRIAHPHLALGREAIAVIPGEDFLDNGLRSLFEFDGKCFHVGLEHLLQFRAGVAEK